MARIFLLEDDPAALRLMSYLLTAAGHRLETCRDGVTGLEAVRARPPELLLCDIQLPRLSGYDVVERMRSDPALRELPVVAVTAFAMRGDREKALEAGFTGYISKPIDPAGFVAQVEDYLPK